MTDEAFSLLRQQLNSNANKQALWLVDENIALDQLASITVSETLTVISNRYDIYRALTALGFNARLSDFDISELSKNSLDVVYYRVSKEKPIVHHIINSAAVCLKTGGQLLLAGYKNEGIKTYVDKAAHYLGGTVEKHRASNSSLLAVVGKATLCDKPLDDKNYCQLVRIKEGENEFVSKPGVYGWNKIDQGSKLLVEQFSSFIAKAGHNGSALLTVADLGCGYGYLSVKASQLLPARFIATDNNIAAVELCKKNFELHEMQGEVIVDDCGASIDQRIDIVLCNPPFHQGFDTVGDLTLNFLHASKRLLKPGGSALFVVNSFIGLEKKARGLFGEVVSLENNGSFKVVWLKK